MPDRPGALGQVASRIGAAIADAAGRIANPIHERERVRFSLLVRLADALALEHPVV